MTLTVRLTDELGRLLRERAARGGQEPAEYVLHLIERDASGPGPGDAGTRTVVDASAIEWGRDEALSDAEFDQLLSELSSGPRLPQLPADFARADVYADHD